MEKEIHLISAKKHFEIAQHMDTEFEKEDSSNKKKAVMTVAAQNYFYSIINFIEFKLSEKNLHSYNHENRTRKIFENPDLFSKKEIELFNIVDRNIRNKVAYRGQNGKNYGQIKNLAKLFFEENG